MCDWHEKLYGIDGNGGIVGEILEKVGINNHDIENDIRKDGYLYQRCVLETVPNSVDRVNKDVEKSNGEHLLFSFLSSVINDLNKETNRASFQKSFYSYISQIKDKDLINITKNADDGWKSYPFLFLMKLSDHRSEGANDTNWQESLFRFSHNINGDSLQYVYELLQNADDCEYPDDIKEKYVNLSIADETISISYPEIGMSRSDILAITDIEKSNKITKKAKKIIGEKGLGFKTIFKVCDSVEIKSGCYHFTLNYGSFKPEINMDPKEVFHNEGTTMVLKLRNNSTSDEQTIMKGNGKKIYEDLLKKYGVGGEKNVEAIFQSCPIFFTNKIEKLVIEYSGNGDLGNFPTKVTIKREKDESSICVKYWINCDDDRLDETDPFICLKCGRYSKSVIFDEVAYKSHYKDVLNDENKNVEDLRTYPIELIYPQEIIFGKEEQSLDLIKMGTLFTYLPTTTRIKAPISFQIPFELNQNRSCMLIKNDYDAKCANRDDDWNYEGNNVPVTTKWNHVLFEKAFCYSEDDPSLLQLAFEGREEQGVEGIRELDEKGKTILRLFPDYQLNNYNFFDEENDAGKNINNYCGSRQDNKIYNCFKNLKVFKVIHSDNSDNSWISINEKPCMFDGFISSFIESDKELASNCMNCEEHIKKLIYPVEEEADKNAIVRDIPVKLKALGLNYYEPFNKTSLMNTILKSLESEKKPISNFVDDYLLNENSKYRPERFEGLKLIKMYDKNGDELPDYWAMKHKETKSVVEQTKWLIYSGDDILNFDSNEDVAIFYLKDETNRDVWNKLLKDNTTISKNTACVEIEESNSNKEQGHIFWNNIEKEYLMKGYENSTPYYYRSISAKQLVSIIELMWHLDNPHNSFDYEKGYDYVKKLIQEDKLDNEKIYELLIWKDADSKTEREKKESNYYKYRKEIQNDEEKEFLDLLRIVSCYHKDETFSLLPPKEWTKKICEEINKIKMGKNIHVNCPTTELKPNNNSNVVEVFEPKKTGFSFKPEIYIYNDLPSDTDFVHFSTLVILREENDDLAKRCLKDINKLYKAILDFGPFKKTLLGEDEDKTVNEVILAPIEKIDASAGYINSSDNTKEEFTIWDRLIQLEMICIAATLNGLNKPNPSDNYIWNELLQNANDHFLDPEQFMNVTVEDNKLILEYPDKGFSVRDFVAVCTNGNSANVLLDKNATGRKGTGFKSVYKLFETVEIESGPVKCTLIDDNVSFSCAEDSEDSRYKKYGYLFIPKNEESSTGNWHYPVPEFEKLNPVNFQKTKITLILNNENSSDNILKMIFGDGVFRGDKDTLKKAFETQRKVLFLDNIKKFHFSIMGMEFDVNRKDYIDNNYYWIDQPFVGIETDNALKYNKYWKEHQEEDKYKKKKKITLLFPKNDEERDSMCENKVPVYCDLPVENCKLQIPFYVNIPLLELEENRNQLRTRENSGDDYTKWNKAVLTDAFGDAFNAYFQEVVSDKGTDIVASCLYKFFPYEYINPSNYLFDDLGWPGIRDIQFIRTEGSKTGEEYKSINDLSGSYFLPDYMYQWLGGAYGEDSREFPETGDFSFVYYKEKLNKTENGSDPNSQSISEYISEKIFGDSNIGDQREDVKKNVIIPYIEKICVNKGGDVDSDPVCLWLRDIFSKDASFCEHLFKGFLKRCRNILDFRNYYYIKFNSSYPGNLDKYNQCELAGGYKAALPLMNEISRFFYSRQNLENLYIDDQSSIKNIFDDLLESPYLRDSGVISLREEPIIEPFEEDTEILVQFTKELFNEKTYNEDEKFKLKTWINNKKLFANSLVGPVPITEKCYFISGLPSVKLTNAEQEKYACRIVSIDGLDHIMDITDSDKRLDEEIDIDDFVINEDDKRLLKLIVKIYSSKKKILSISVKNPSKYKLSQQLFDRFDNRVDEREKEGVVSNKDFGGLSLENIVKKRIMLFDCPGKESVYCYGRYNNEKVILLCSEKAFETMLRNDFACNSYYEEKQYDDMRISTFVTPSKLQNTDAIKERLRERAEKILNKCNWNNDEKRDEETLKRILIEKWEVPVNGDDGKKLYVRSNGYGVSKGEPKCPVCGSMLIAEASVLKLSNIYYKGTSIPMPMCSNCHQARNYAYPVKLYGNCDECKLDLEERNCDECKHKLEDLLKLFHPNKQKLWIKYDMYARNTKFLEVDVSYLNRWLWFCLLQDKSDL